MAFKLELFGEFKLMRKLDSFKARKADKLLRNAVLAGARIVAKAIKKEVPSVWKAGRKAIGASARKDSTNGILYGKAGAGAGVRRTRRAKLIAEHKFNRKSKRKGVGLAVNNFHWFLMGTADRQTKAGHRTGRMKKTPIVARGYRASSKAARAAMIANLRNGIEREASKG